jgi:hypothetical protein
MIEQNKKKKKLTLNTVGLILLAVILVAYFYVWKSGVNVKAQVFELSNNVTIAELQTKTIAAPADDLETRLNQVKAELAATQTGFPASVDRNQVIDYLLDTAGDYGVDILPLMSDGWAVENTGQEYIVLKITAIAEGALKDIEKFMTGLQNGRYPTLVISQCTVERKDVALPGFPGDEMMVIVNMKIDVYTVASWLTEDSL